MCLSKVIGETGRGWKVFLKKNGVLRGSIQEEKVEKGWNTATTGRLLTEGGSEQRYSKGFHVFLNREDAVEHSKQCWSPCPDDETIEVVEVEYKQLRAVGFGTDFAPGIQVVVGAIKVIK